MTTPPETAFVAADPQAVAGIEGRIAIFADAEGKLDPMARRVDRLSRGAVARLVASPAFARAKVASGHVLAHPQGLAAEAVQVVKLPRRPSADEARRAGAAIAGFNADVPMAVLAPGHRQVAEIALGLGLRAYSFEEYRSDGDDEDGEPAKNRSVTFHVKDPETAEAEFAPLAAQVAGTYFTRDLTNEPANVLTTTEFVARLEALREVGVEVEVLDEGELARLGMRALLGVGQGSESPSYVVVMHWKGGGGAAPVAFLGKGVVFDTGGISIKPAQGMEEMTMDMGGAGVVAGVMKTLALRKARADVVGLVGLVENMPDGRAQRPGDVVRSLKGDTIEVINTDAEGRLVLADVLWYVQDRFAPRAMVDLATLTGAIIVALGHENAGVFCNDDDLADALLDAAAAEGEGAWRMPLGPAYDKLIKSRIADMANTGGRPAGAITAAQFLKRFVRDDVPWAHIDIAGAAYDSKGTDLAPKGPTGWGVRTLDRLVRERFEG